MESAANLTIKRVPIASLRPDPANPRSHDERNLSAIKASLERFGQAEPLVVQSSTQRLIAGHGRLEAMKVLGWTSCDVVELDVDDLKATALGIAMNRTSDMSSFDLPALSALLDTLRAEDALVGVGFTTEEIDEMLRDLHGEPQLPLDDPGPGEVPVDPVTRPGDLWILGDQTILCGDSTNRADIERVLAGEKAALLSSDPPYCVDYTGNDRPIHDGKPSGKDWTHVYREVDIADLGQFMDQVFTACLPHVEDDAAVYIWHAHVQQPVIATCFERHGLLLHQILVWIKPTATFGHSFYRWRHEPCAFGWRKGHKPTHGYGDLETVWECDWEGKSRVVGNEHPTQKPLRLFEIPMEQHTKPGAIVLEPFSGSGTQILSAEKLGRRCRAVEISPAFVDVAVRRWQEATGKKATLADLAAAYSTQMESDGKSAGTIASYGMELKVAQDEIGAETPLASLTQAQVETFFNSKRVTKLRSGKAKSQLSIDKTRRVLRLALTWAESRGIVSKAPIPEKAEAK